MKFSLIVLFATPLLSFASPTPVDSSLDASMVEYASPDIPFEPIESTPNDITARELEKRLSTCKVKYLKWFTKKGVCINTNKSSCKGGKLYPGHCPGGNEIICCVP